MTMKKIIFTILSAGFISGGLALSPAISMPAHAQLSGAKQIIDKAKSKGVVGETIAGYLALTGSSASSEVINAMNEINIRRKSVYTEAARAQNVQIDVIATITGEKLIAKAKAGEKILDNTGNWITVR